MTNWCTFLFSFLFSAMMLGCYQRLAFSYYNLVKSKVSWEVGFMIRRSLMSYEKRYVPLPLQSLFQRGRSFHMTNENDGEKDENYDIVEVRAKDVVIPLDKVEFNYARSSGPGGQNVNKLNTKAEIRFHVMSADWIPAEAKHRLSVYQSNKISKDGYLIVSSQESRTQTKNKEACLQKLRNIIAEALITPKEREMWIGLSDKTKEKRKQDKRKRAEVKANRRKNFDKWD